MEVRSFSGTNIPDISVNVYQIAKAQRNAGTDLRADAREIPPGTFSFEIEADGETHTIEFTTTENLTNRAFQQRMADAINDAEIGIDANVSVANGRSTLTLATSATGASEDGEPRFTIRDVTGNAVELTGVDTMTQEAQNAIFTVNGEDRVSETNDVDLGHGLAVTLLGVSDEPVTFAPGRDAAGMRTNVRNMVNQFNALLEVARENSSDPRTRSVVRELESVIRRSRRSLEEIGISVNDNGLLTINEAALTTASNNGAIERFLGESNGQRAPFIRVVSRITDSLRTNPTRHISPHTVRQPSFHVALNAVANGNTLANEPQSPFNGMSLEDMMGNLFNMLR